MRKIVGILAVIVACGLAIASNACKPKQEKHFQIFLFSRYTKNVDMEKFDVKKDDAYIVESQKCSVDLKQERLLLGGIKAIGKLPLPAAVFGLSAKSATVDLSTTWHTVVVIEFVYIGDPVTTEPTVYTTTYGRRIDPKTDKSSYVVIKPRSLEAK